MDEAQEAPTKNETDVETDSCDDDDKIPITTTTKNALITTQLGHCDVYPHRVKVSIVGIGKVGVACAIAILMRRLASEVCLIDHDANKASAEAEDIQHHLRTVHAIRKLRYGKSEEANPRGCTAVSHAQSAFIAVAYLPPKNRGPRSVRSKTAKIDTFGLMSLASISRRSFGSIDGHFRQTRRPFEFHVRGPLSTCNGTGSCTLRALIYASLEEKERIPLHETVEKEISMMKESAVVIISACEIAPGETPNVKHNYKIFKTLIPSIARFACKSVLLVVTQPTDVMSYITWKLSGFPSNRVLGTGTMLDCARFQDLVSRRLNMARSSVNCMTIGAQGDMSVPIWSSIHVGGMKLRDINPRIGEQDDPEKWHEITEAVKNSGKELDEKKGLNCWGHALCTSEIVDAIVRNTKVVLPASTHIHSCTHGTDKDVYMSVPCVIGREGVYCTVRQKLTDQEKAAVQACADSIRVVLRECGVLQESKNELEE